MEEKSYSDSSVTHGDFNQTLMQAMAIRNKLEMLSNLFSVA